MDLKMTGAGVQQQANLTSAMKQRMNYLIARQGIVSSNVANASTPGYVARDLAFTSEVEKAGIALNTTNANHIEGGNDAIKSFGKVTYDTSNMRDDGNSVKLDEEMLKLSDIQLNYKLITSLYSKNAGMYKMVIKGNQ